MKKIFLFSLTLVFSLGLLAQSTPYGNKMYNDLYMVNANDTLWIQQDGASVDFYATQDFVFNGPVSGVTAPSGTSSTLFATTAFVAGSTSEAIKAGAGQVTFLVGTEGGVVTYTSALTVTLSGTYPTINTDAQLGYIKVIPASGDAYILVNGADTVTLRHSAGVITLSGISGPFLSGDVYEVGISAPSVMTDYTIGAQKSIVQNPIWARYTDPADILTGDLTLTTSWADLGTEVDMRGYKELYIYLTLDINDASDVRFRALGKWESAGTDEYNMVISTVSSSDIKVEAEYVEFNTDADQLVILHVSTGGGIPYIQLQGTEGTDGGTDAIFTGPTKGVKVY